jgi:hypothetical protein
MGNVNSVKAKLSETHPQIASEWHPILNGDLSSDKVTYGNGSKVWWLCKKGHNFSATINNRTSKGSGCPVCSGRLTEKGVNDFITQFPLIAKELHDDKIDLSVLSKSSKIIATWQCSKNNKHIWRTSVANRSVGSGCPYCNGKKAFEGETDLLTLNPVLSKEWNYKLNGTILPNQVTVGSEKKVWWLCNESHEWQATIINRHKNRGCPLCAKYGFKNNETSVLYFIKNERLESFKIGITNLRTNRLNDWEKSGWEMLFSFVSKDGKIIQEVESIIKSWLFKELKLYPKLNSKNTGSMGGWTETFSIYDISEKEVIDKIQEITSLNNPSYR